MGGSSTELHQNLHACLRVGRLDIASTIVRKLTELHDPALPEVLEAHRAYLSAAVDAIEHSPDVSARTLQHWFEVDIRAAGVPLDPQIVALMLKGVIRGLEGSQRARSVRRYLHLAAASGQDFYDDTIASDIIGNDEFEVLQQVTDQWHKTPNTRDFDAPVEEAVGKPESRTASAAAAASPSPTVKLRAMEQKGLGLETLQKSLSIFDGASGIEYPHEHPGSQEEKDRIFQVLRQERLEEDAVDAALERWRVENEKMQKMGINSSLHTKPLEALMYKWYTDLEPLLAKELEEVKGALDDARELALRPTESGRGHAATEARVLYGPYIGSFTSQKLAAHTIMTILTMIGTGEARRGHTVTNMIFRLCSDLENWDSMQTLQKKAKDAERTRISDVRKKALADLSKTANRFASAVENSSKPSKSSKSANLTEQHHSDVLRQTEWPTTVKARVGAMLLEKLMEVAKIEIPNANQQPGEGPTLLQPAFAHVVDLSGGQRVGLVKANATLLEKMRKEPVRGTLGTRLPMVAEPKPWTGYKEGGFYRYPMPFMRTAGDDLQRAYGMAAANRGDLEQVFRGLDVLGKTPWRINREVFDVAVQVWNTGEAFAKIPAESPEVPLPPEPPADASKEERRKWRSEVKAVEDKLNGYHSNRCFQNFQLEVARAYRDEVFYYPHNIDFRGRAYPIPALLNHIGADMGRGLMKFGVGKELGIVGLSWLKIHVANVYGFDKASLKEREEWTMEHLDDIYDSAVNPLGGRQWWKKAEDPWQCLASCFELRAALDSPDPTRFVSHIPVHQDGTCNGLQHYAALGGDRSGAAQVNLEPGDRPADIYTGVKELVQASIAKDAAEGNVYGQFLVDRITRKVVKQTVMTNVYGVTFIGAIEQVQKQLVALYEDVELPDGVASLKQCAVYIARKIFNALGTMFTGAQDIQYWLGEAANRICTAFTMEQIQKIEDVLDDVERVEPGYRKVGRKMCHKGGHKAAAIKDASHFKSVVTWTTPLKLPVVQPYRAIQSQNVTTSLQNVAITSPNSWDPVSRRKQLQAFPPNFIHSLDATHMFLSAIMCHEQGLTFASVHDCFWTHASDVPTMNLVLRDAFVQMHSEDIIGRLAEEFKARYAGSLYLATVDAKSEVGKKIAEYRKLSKKSSKKVESKKVAKTGRNDTIDELLREKERQKLLKSDNPNERQQGLAMTTPGSIFESYADPAAFLPLDDITETVLGHVDEAAARKRDTSTTVSTAPVTDRDVDHTEQPQHANLKMAEAANDAATEAEHSEHDNPLPGGAPNTKKKQRVKKLKLWLPLTFPPVPKKGDFDVRKLKDSQYFFS